MSYPISASGMSIFLFLAIAFTTKIPFAATASTALAWTFYVTGGLLFGTVHLRAVSPYFFPPFPFLVPALVFDLCMLGLLKRQSFFSPQDLFAPVFTSITVCYWGIVAWVGLYTKLPHALSDKPVEWVVGYVLVVVVFIPAVTTVASFLSHWLSGGDVSAEDRAPILVDDTISQ